MTTKVTKAEDPMGVWPSVKKNAEKALNKSGLKYRPECIVPVGKDFKKLIPSGIYATPKDTKALASYLENFGGDEAVVAQTCAMMAWNLACKVQAENIANGWVKDGWDK